METTDLTPVILTNIQADIAELKSTLHTEVNRLDDKIDKLDTRIDKLESKIDRLDGKFDSKIDMLDARMDRMHTRIVEMDLRMTTAHQENRVLIDKVLRFLDDHGSIEHRVDRCERDIVDLKARMF